MRERKRDMSVGSYQVGYTRSHLNTEVKMLRACSVPLCSHRWERQVTYHFVIILLLFLLLRQRDGRWIRIREEKREERERHEFQE